MHSHRYLWFISSTVSYRYSKSTSLLKCCVSTTSICWTIKVVNITLQSVSCIHAEWAILGDYVPWTCPAASRRWIFYWNIATGLNHCNDRLILRPTVEINCYEYLVRHIFWSTWNTKVIAQSRGWFRCLPSPAVTTNQKKWRIAGAGRCREKHLMMIKYIAIEFVQARQIVRKVNTILET